MTIAQLVEELQKYPAHMPAQLDVPDEDGIYSQVSIDEVRHDGGHITLTAGD